MEDMRDVFSKRQGDLERMLETAELTNDQKKMILTAMEFGYAAAFCAKICDINESYFQAHNYERGYKQIIGKLN